MRDMASIYFQSDGRNHNYFSVISDLVSLTAHISASIDRLALAIATELPSSNLESYDNTIVLDDITPRYLSANTALHACQAQLGMALHCLQDINVHEIDASDHSAVRLAGRDDASAGRA